MFSFLLFKLTIGFLLLQIGIMNLHVIDFTAYKTISCTAEIAFLLQFF